MQTFLLSFFASASASKSCFTHGKFSAEYECTVARPSFARLIATFSVLLTYIVPMKPARVVKMAQRKRPRLLTTLLVNCLKLDLNVALHVPPYRKIVGLCSKGFALVGGITRSARCADAGEDKGENLILLRQ